MFSLCQAESGLPTDTIVPDPNPCTAAGCANYRVTPKAYGIKAFDFGSHGDAEPVVIANPQKINLTAYAVGASHDLYVTIINKTHSTTHDAITAAVVIQAAPWSGKWTPLGRVRNGKFALTVASTTAVIVRIRAAGR
jgi:hypothetical protein